MWQSTSWLTLLTDEYRICCNWHNHDAYDVEITDYH